MIIVHIKSENNLGWNLDPAKFEVSGVFWKEYLDSKWKQSCSSFRKTHCNYCDNHQILWRLMEDGPRLPFWGKKICRDGWRSNSVFTFNLIIQPLLELLGRKWSEADQPPIWVYNLASEHIGSVRRNLNATSQSMWIE